MTQTFPTRLAHLVSLSGLPVAQIEDLAGLARSHIQKLTKEERKPTTKTGRKIASVFVASREVQDIENCTAWLLFGTGRAPSVRSAKEGIEAATARRATKKAAEERAS